MRRRLAPQGLRPGEMAGEPQARAVKVHGLHAHGCQQCGHRYEDACLDSERNHLCAGCRSAGHHERPLWERNGDPADCCRTDSLEATKSVRQRYRLAGDTRWWICKTCSRTHPYDPDPGGQL